MGKSQEYTNLNQIIGKWLERTLWLWLPFYAIVRLTKDVVAKHTKK
jgi:hypothetical protein